MSGGFILFFFRVKINKHAVMGAQGLQFETKALLIAVHAAGPPRVQTNS